MHSATQPLSNAPLRFPDHFSDSVQEQRYFEHYKPRDLIEPKFFDLEFFEGENFDCYAIFKSLGLVKFMSFRKPILSGFS